MTVVAITRPPAGVDSELRQVRESSSDQVRIDSRRGAAHQSPKRIQIYRICSLGLEVGVKESMVSDFISGVVVDVYGQVFVEHLNGRSVGLMCCPAVDCA